MPFIAYWHPQGYGLMRTGEIDYRDPDTGKRRKKRVSERTKKTFFNNLLKLKKSRPWTKIIYIEYDGQRAVEQEV